MRKPLWILFLLLFAKSAYSQIEADSIFVYQNFKNAGTTAGLGYNHKVLASTQAKQAKLTEQEMKDIKRFFGETKKKRFFQQKHGGEICYALVWYAGRRYRYVIEGSSSWAGMVNLDTMRKWTLDEPEKVKGFQEIIRNNWP